MTLGGGKFSDLALGGGGARPLWGVTIHKSKVGAKIFGLSYAPDWSQSQLQASCGPVAAGD